MDYELDKRLKEAGFPQKPQFGDYEFRIVGNRMLLHGITKEENIDQKNKNIFRVPTLEELIEACGNNFYSLSNSAYWIVDSNKEGIEDIYGNTPSEAVANLWLALNKKDNDLRNL